MSHMNKSSRRTSSGALLAEYPAALWLFLIGIAFPMMGIASFGYRSVLFYLAVRDSGLKAAKATSYTQASATAQTTFSTDMSHFSGITGTLTTRIMEKPLNGNSPNYYSAPMVNPIPNTTANLYFIDAIGKGTVQPLFPTGPILGMNVPGLSGPYPMQVKYDAYDENPSSLNQ